jgi:hypothetical protein
VHNLFRNRTTAAQVEIELPLQGIVQTQRIFGAFYSYKYIYDSYYKIKREHQIVQYKWVIRHKSNLKPKEECNQDRRPEMFEAELVMVPP